MHFRLSAVVLAIATASMLQGCNGSSSNTPPPPAYANISGDYTGTWSDAQSTSVASVSGTLSQHGSSAAGTMTDGGAFSAQMSLALSHNNSFSGAITIDQPGGAACTFSTTGTYDTSSNVLNGTYTAVTNCSGDTGSYSLTQQCYDTVTSVDRRKPMGLVKC